MARLPGPEALGERPTPVPARRPPMVATYRGTSGFEGVESQALAHTGDDLRMTAGIVLQAQEHQDAVRAEDAATRLREKQIEMTFGKNGFVNLKGGDAVNKPLLKEYGSAFDGHAQQIADGLDNDNQRQMFRRRAQVSGLQLREDIARHVVHESNVYAETVFKSNVDVESKMAGARWAADDGAAVPLLRIDAAIDNEARRRGLSGDEGKVWADDQKMQARSKVYSAQVQAALNSDPTTGPFAAQALLKANGDSIDPVMRAVLNHQVAGAIRPIQAKVDAEKSVKDVISKVEAEIVAGTNGAFELTAADVAAGGTVRYAIKDKDGKILYGEATPEAVLRIAASARGDPRGLQTKSDVQALIGDAVAAAEKNAEITRPGDLQYRDEVVRNVKDYFGTIIAARNGQQKGDTETLIRGLNPQQGVPPTTRDQLLADPAMRAAYNRLDPSQQLGIDGHLHQNLMRAQGAALKEDGAVVSDLANRVYLPADDPMRIRSISQLLPYLAPGKGLNQSAFGFLSALIDKSNSMSGNGKWSQDVNRVSQTARLMLARSHQGSIQPELAEEAAYRFMRELDGKIDDYAKAGKDPRDLFTPGKAEYVLNPANVMGYLNSTAREATASAAAAVQGPVASQPADITTRDKLDAWLQTLPPEVKTFRGTDGNVYAVPSRAPAPAAPGTPPPATLPAATVPAPAQPPKPKGELPQFKAPGAEYTDEDRAMHQGALWEAVKAAVKAPVAMGQFTARTYQDIYQWLSELPEGQQAKGWRGAFNAVLQQDTFSKDDIRTIQQALKYGELSKDERKKARAMLEAAGAKE